jgi:protein SCO1/2
VASNAYYGSGFTNGTPPPNYLTGHTTVDLSLGKDFGERLTLSATIGDNHLLIDNSLTFGGFHFNNPREVYVEFATGFSTDWQNAKSCTPSLSGVQSRGSKGEKMFFGSSFIRKYSEAAFLILTLALPTMFGGCSKSTPPPAQETQPKRYHLVGRVVSIDQQHATLNVDGQEIPGFMAAMTMPYSVRDAKSLSSLNPGDEITADVVVTSDGAYLENIVVTKKAAAGTAKPSAGATHQPQPGENVADFAMIDQDGKRIHLSSFRGDVVLVTFIYTRCPFPDFCPLVSRNFARIYAQLRNDPAADAKRVRLLTLSFDSRNDTPAVLRKYAHTFDQTTGGHPFDRWDFATVPAKELPSVANFFDLYYSVAGDQITHSLSTTVINPDGTVYKWYEDNDWKPGDLITDAQQSLQQSNRRNAGPHPPRHPPNA